jgi:hypothetical protein
MPELKRLTSADGVLEERVQVDHVNLPEADVMTTSWNHLVNR